MEKRKGDSPVPENVGDLLNETQMLTLRQMQSFGWELTFVRRPLFQKPTAVLISADGLKSGILEEDGSFNTQHDIDIRKLTSDPLPSRASRS